VARVFVFLKLFDANLFAEVSLKLLDETILLDEVRVDCHLVDLDGHIRQPLLRLFEANHLVLHAHGLHLDALLLTLNV